MEHKIEWAIAKWADRATATYHPLYVQATYTDGNGVEHQITADSFGRQLGDPFFGNFRPICKDELFSVEDYRYYCFKDSEEEVIIYMETGYSASPISGSALTGLTIKMLRLARPYFDDAAHLVVQSATLPDYSDAETIIDTSIEADRAKVLAYNGSAYVECPVEGMGGVFSGQTVLVDITSFGSLTFLRYKWTSSGGDSDWYATYAQSVGEAYVAANDHLPV